MVGKVSRLILRHIEHVSVCTALCDVTEIVADTDFFPNTTFIFQKFWPYKVCIYHIGWESLRQLETINAMFGSFCQFLLDPGPGAGRVGDSWLFVPHLMLMLWFPLGIALLVGPCCKTKSEQTFVSFTLSSQNWQLRWKINGALFQKSVEKISRSWNIKYFQAIGTEIFIGPESDHWLCLSLTN